MNYFNMLLLIQYSRSCFKKIIEELSIRNEKYYIVEIYLFYYRLNICDNELYTEEDDIQIIIDLFNNSKRVRRLIINNFDSKETNKRMNIIKISTTK